MAGIQLSSPDLFNFKTPDDWPRWRRRFEQFRVASGLAADGDAEKQITMLLYCLGEQSEAVFESTKPTEEERKDYTKVLEKFDAFFAVRKNVIFERARFNRRNQQPGENVDQYIMALHTLAASCNYGAMEDELIRDRLVVGILDKNLSARLQLDPDLDLEKAKKCIRQRESVNEHQSALQETTTPNLEAISRGPKKRQHYTQRSERIRTPNTRLPKQSNRQQCTRCGKEPHSRDKCPAKDAVCNRCHKKGHYGALCLSKRIVVDSTAELDTAFLDSTTATDKETAWFTDIDVGDQLVRFKMDTGAEVTAIFP